MEGISKLTKFEKELLQFLFSRKEKNYINHIDCLAVCNREYTGAGQYIDFEYVKTPLFLEEKTLSIGSNIYIELTELEYGAGCFISIVNGRIQQLELFAHGEEEFPREISNFKFRELS